MIKPIIKIAATLLVISTAAIAVYFSFFRKDKEKITVDAARIHEVKTMVKMCAMDIYREVPVLDTINGKAIFAIQKQRGSISFDIENLHIDTSGDTVCLTLPPETVEIMESTEDNAWQVIDTKHVGFLGSLRNERISEREENRVKDKLRRNSIRKLYQDGTVAHARQEAAKNLETLLEKIYRKPVKVTIADKQ